MVRIFSPFLSKKQFSACFAASVLALSSSAQAQEERVNFYNWSDYIGETTLEDFTAQTGIEVIYDVYDSNELLESKLFAGNSGYDVVVPSAQPFLARQIVAGVYQELDAEQIPNLRLLDPFLMEQVAIADPGNAYAAIYQWGTTGLGYNVEMVQERLGDSAPVESWDLLFVPENAAALADCGIALLDSHAEVIPIVLHYLGFDPNSTDEEELQAAQAVLTAIRPHIRYFHSSQYINDLANGDICLALGWSGDILQASYRAQEVENGVEIRYTIPAEGTMLWFDVLAIPADAPNPEAAHQLINFLLEPKNMAGITNYVAYAHAVPEADAFIDPEIRADTQIFPPAEVMENLFTTTLLPEPVTRMRSRVWTQITSGY